MGPEGSLPNSQQPVTCPCPESDQFSPYHQPTSVRSILILSSHLLLGLPSGLHPSDFPTKTLYAPPLPHTCNMPCPSQSFLFYHRNYIWSIVQSIKFLVMQSSPLPCYLVPLRPKSPPQHPVSKIFGLFSYLTVSDQVSQDNITNHITILHRKLQCSFWLSLSFRGFSNERDKTEGNLRNMRSERTFAVIGVDFSCCSKATGGRTLPQIFSSWLTGS